MKTFHHRFTTQEKLAILSEADQFGTLYVLKTYNLAPSVFSRWQKDLNSSKSRQASIKKESESLTIESLTAEIERLKKVIDDLNTPKQGQEQIPPMDKATANKKAEELYRLVASLIVEIVIKDFDAKCEAEDMQIRESKS